jgi:cyclase
MKRRSIPAAFTIVIALSVTAAAQQPQPPTRTFRRTLTLFSGADQVDLLYFGRGHTDGDTWVFFRALGVVHVGDLFPGDELPRLDASNGGSALEICRTLDTGYRSIKGATLVIRGHGVEQTWQQLREYHARRATGLCPPSRP